MSGPNPDWLTHVLERAVNEVTARVIDESDMSRLLLSEELFQLKFVERF